MWPPDQFLALQADSDIYISEIDSIHNAYEEMLGQNTRLLQQLTERDEANNQLLSERIKGTQTAMKLAGERDAAVDAHRHSQEASQMLQSSLSELERRLQVSCRPEPSVQFCSLLAIVMQQHQPDCCPNYCPEIRLRQTLQDCAHEDHDFSCLTVVYI